MKYKNLITFLLKWGDNDYIIDVKDEQVFNGIMENPIIDDKYKEELRRARMDYLRFMGKINN